MIFDRREIRRPAMIRTRGKAVRLRQGMRGQRQGNDATIGFRCGWITVWPSRSFVGSILLPSR